MRELVCISPPSCLLYLSLRHPLPMFCSLLISFYFSVSFSLCSLALCFLSIFRYFLDGFVISFSVFQLIFNVSFFLFSYHRCYCLYFTQILFLVVSLSSLVPFHSFSSFLSIIVTSHLCFVISLSLPFLVVALPLRLLFVSLFSFLFFFLFFFLHQPLFTSLSCLLLLFVISLLFPPSSLLLPFFFFVFFFFLFISLSSCLLLSRSVLFLLF